VSEDEIERLRTNKVMPFGRVGVFRVSGFATGLCYLRG
jgi:hypothetical protein